MRPGLGALFRTATFRLALWQAAVMLCFVAVLLVLIYAATIGQVEREANALAELEYAALERAYAEGGVRRLNQEVVERAARQGPMLYVLAETDGTVISGDFLHLPRIPGGTPERVDFRFQRDDRANAASDGRARGRVGRLLGGPILLVARDLSESNVLSRRLASMLWIAGAIGVVLSIAAGYIASTEAARRAEALSNTARDVMAGDLSRRAPTHGDNDEFGALANDLNAMLDRLERLVHTTRTAGDAIAHDLRSPLTRFRQRLEAALEAPPDAGADREALRVALEEADKVLDMFAAVLKLARVESAHSWRFTRVDLTAILEELAEFYAPAAEDCGLSFGADIAPGLAIRGEGGLIAQAVSNLIENAIKYTPAGGRIMLVAQPLSGARIEVSVRDDGPGVPAEERQRVIERFVRLENSRSTPGVGLGLSLVDAVAQLHRGVLALGAGLTNAGRTGLAASIILPSIE